MEFKNDSTLLTHQRFEFVADHVYIELRHVELLVPCFVKLVRVYEFCKLDILESFKTMLFGQLGLKQRAERSLANAWGTCD